MTTKTSRHAAPDLAELRRLLDDYRAASGLAPIVDAWYEVARAALAALPALLDAAERDALAADADKWQRAALTLQGDRDALRAELAHMTEARDNARAEVERLAGRLDAVRALHSVASVGMQYCIGCGAESRVIGAES